jgi:hypothetical protein
MTDRAAHLLLTLHELADGEEVCATVRHLASASQLGETAVMRALRELVAEGAIHPTGKRGNTTVFLLSSASPGAESPRRQAADTPPPSEGVSVRPDRPVDDLAAAPGGDSDVATADKKIRNAERWLKHNGGFHLDREEEVEDHLFGPRGMLKPFANDPELRARMLALWRGYRQTGVKLDREAAERNEGWKQNRARLGETKRPARNGTEVPTVDPFELLQDLTAKTSRNGNGYGYGDEPDLSPPDF